MEIWGIILIVIHTLLFVFMRSRTRKQAKKHKEENSRLKVLNRNLNAQIKAYKRQLGIK